MAEAVAEAIADGRHLVVQAGTGTGQVARLPRAGHPVGRADAWWPPPPRRSRTSWPARTCPFLAEHLDRPFAFAVLKGRSNYLCRQRLDEADRRRRPARRSTAWTTGRRAVDASCTSSPTGPRPPPTGDRAELAREPSAGAWAAVSVGARRVPGRGQAARRASDCFAEDGPRSGRRRPTSSWSTPTSTASHLAAGGAVLPEHDVVVIDEAHQLEDIVSATCGRRADRPAASPPWPASSGRSSTTRPSATTLERPATALAAALADRRRPPPARRARARDLDAGAGRRPQRLDEAVRRAAQRSTRRRRPTSPTRKAAGHEGRRPRCIDDIDVAIEPDPRRGRWVEEPGDEPVPPGRADRRRRRAAPSGLWEHRTAVLTSATIPPGLAERLGLDRRRRSTSSTSAARSTTRPTPSSTAPPTCPTPASRGYEEAAARRARGAHHGRRRAHAGPVHQLPGHGGRGRRAPRRAARRPVLTQGDLPKPALVAAFADDESTCLFATMGFWQGVDVPGPRRCRWSPSTGCRSPAPTSRCSRPAASGPGPTPSASSTCPGPPRCWPRAPAG